MLPRRRWTSSEGLKHKYAFSSCLLQKLWPHVELRYMNRSAAISSETGEGRSALDTGFYSLQNLDVRRLCYAEGLSMDRPSTADLAHYNEIFPV